MRGLISLCPKKTDCGDCGERGRERKPEPGVVLGREFRFIRAGPNLKEVNLFGSVTFLAMPDASTGRGHLNISTLQHLGVSHRVLTVSAPHHSACTRETRRPEYALLELSIHNVRKYLKLAVRVSSKSSSRINPILIEDTQVPKTHVTTISISERRII